MHVETCPDRKIDFQPNDLVEAIWIDAESDSGWMDEEGVSKPPKTKFKTVGYFSRSDSDYLYLSWSIGIEGNKDRSRDVIPWGCIKNVEVIKNASATS